MNADEHLVFIRVHLRLSAAQSSFLAFSGPPRRRRGGVPYPPGRGTIMKTIWIGAAALIAAAGLASAETKAGLTESVTIGGKTISIKYSAPAVNKREGKLFGKDGQVGSDPTYPVWRAGANAATALHTDADLDLGG